jgi:hypothetical protein
MGRTREPSGFSAEKASGSVLDGVWPCADMPRASAPIEAEVVPWRKWRRDVFRPPVSEFVRMSAKRFSR